MHKKPAFILFFSAAWLLAAQAHLGDTPRQAAEKFGPPVGEIRMDGKEIQIYETQWGRVTETYNSDGFCIESDVNRFPELAALKNASVEPARKPAGQPSAAAPPAPSEAGFDVPQNTPLNRWPFIGIALALSALVGTVTVILLNRRAPCLSSADSKDDGTLSAFIEKQASENA